MEVVGGYGDHLVEHPREDPRPRDRLTPIERRVLELMPRFLGHERVAAIGEAGLEQGGLAEEAIFRLQARLARHHGLPFVVRLPMFDRATREWRTSPTTATCSPSIPPSSSSMV